MVALDESFNKFESADVAAEEATWGSSSRRMIVMIQLTFGDLRIELFFYTNMNWWLRLETCRALKLKVNNVLSIYFLSHCTYNHYIYLDQVFFNILYTTSSLSYYMFLWFFSLINRKNSRCQIPVKWLMLV